MQPVIFVFYLFIAFTMGLSGDIDDDIAERMAQFLLMSKTDVQICINKTYVNTSLIKEDLMRLDQFVDDNIETIDIDKSILKVGCLGACLLQKKELMSSIYINEVKLKEFVNSISDYRYKPEQDRILNICIDRVKSKSNECEIIFKLIQCAISETRRLMRGMQ
ncbi:uncharacterized protein LOC126851327 [Cataglyphis hispanica]|uniref:uncharacterized protein LOC126851327 n=1 Tax=Cataglyphis hispanica TaxID=1086592 RepID=UPI00217F6703|nr:uncharacterized protein LOC126851327 [Cataglyphis hispanica]